MYSVQPEPAPSPLSSPSMISMKAGTSSQKLMLFSRGNAMSGAPIISGTNQLPKPPIMAGITVKKIMIRPCAVTSAFQACPTRSGDCPGSAAARA